MLTDVVIEDYQALHRAHLGLGKFTVVTGPTGSGKSAVIRAIRLCAFNARGTAFIRNGARSCQVCLHEQEWSVAIQRGGRGKDAYRIALAPGELLEFTKLAGAVPGEAAALLKLDEVNFAGQFDRPFLLAESGSQVARVLGELTNVTLVLDAAREANRRKLEVARQLRSQEDILRSLTGTAQRFRTLAARRAAVAGARRHSERAEFLGGQVLALQQLYDRWYRADLELGELEMGYGETAPPSAEALDSLQAKLSALTALYARHREAMRAEGQWGSAADTAAREEKQAHLDLYSALLAAGTCPTCGREMHPDD